MIPKALEVSGEGLTPADVLDRIKTGQAQYWSAPGAEIITEADALTVHIWLAGGSLAGVIDLYQRVETWARRIGAKDITIDGRPGWRRVAKAYGFEAHGHGLRKVL